METLILIGLCLLPFAVAYLFYKIGFYLLEYLKFGGELILDLIANLKRIVLVIGFEIAALISLTILALPLNYTLIFAHILIVLLIGTIGFGLAIILKTIYRFILLKHQTEALEEFSKRSIITQAQILYRVTMFVIIVLTFASMLITLPGVRSFGIGILGSAGIAGIALGLAARPILLNFIAGFQIAFTKLIKIGDAVVIEGENGRVDQIFLTHVIIKTWDLRKLIVPISDFINKPFQNWSSESTELLGTLFLYCDYQAPFDIIKKKAQEIMLSTPLWNQKLWGAELVDMDGHCVKMRIVMSANNPNEAFSLHCLVREKLIEFLQREHPEALPKIRYEGAP